MKLNVSFARYTIEQSQHQREREDVELTCALLKSHVLIKACGGIRDVVRHAGESGKMSQLSIESQDWQWAIFEVHKSTTEGFCSELQNGHNIGFRVQQPIIFVINITHVGVKGLREKIKTAFYVLMSHYKWQDICVQWGDVLGSPAHSEISLVDCQSLYCKCIVAFTDTFSNLLLLVKTLK